MYPRFASLALAVLVSAGALHAASKWTNGNVKVANILWRPDLKAFYAEPGTMDNPDGCPGGASNIYELSSAVTSDAERNRLIAILLSAKGDGSKVNVWVDGCGGYGPTFTGLQINN
jgi:hypothetical protein